MSSLGTIYPAVFRTRLKIHLSAKWLAALLTWSMFFIFSCPARADLNVPATSSTGEVILTWSAEVPLPDIAREYVTGGAVYIYEKREEDASWTSVARLDMEADSSVDLARTSGRYY